MSAFPLLVLVPPADSDCSPHKVFSLPDQKLHNVTPPANKVCFATPQGWVLVLSSTNSSPHDAGTYLLNLQDGSRIELSTLMDDEVPGTCRCILSNAVVAPGCGVLVFHHGSTEPEMWFCRVGQDLRWSRHGFYDLLDSPPSNRKFYDVVAVNGRFFFYESQDSLGTLDFHTKDASEELEARLGAIAVPSIDPPKAITSTYVVESCNDLFLVHMGFDLFCFERPGELQLFDRPGELQVYRMDFSEPPVWRKTGCIGDRAFLLGDSNFAASCSASGCGLKPNCVYWVNNFSQENSDLHVLDLQDGAWASVKQFDNVVGVQKPFWIVPVVA